LTTRDVCIPKSVLHSLPLSLLADRQGVILSSTPHSADVVRVRGYVPCVERACAELLTCAANAMLERAREAVAAPMSAAPSRHECAVCLTDEPVIANVPCGHVVLCERDAIALARSGAMSCVVCRMPVTNFLRIFQ